MSDPFLRLFKASIKKLLTYYPISGLFVWKTNKGTRRRGEIAGTVRVDGYTQIQVNHQLYYAHRLAFLFMLGRWPIGEVDHLNNTPADNSWKNLREVSHRENIKRAYSQEGT